MKEYVAIVPSVVLDVANARLTLDLALDGVHSKAGGYHDVPMGKGFQGR